MNEYVKKIWMQYLKIPECNKITCNIITLVSDEETT